MRNILMWITATLSLSAAFGARAQDAAADAIRLGVHVVDDHGYPLDGVAVTVRAGEGERAYDGGLSGRLMLELSEGVHELAFSRPDFYDLVLRDVVIELPEDPRERPQAFEPLRVVMQRRLILERDLPIIGPRYVDPPPFEVAFEPRGPVVQGRPARGVFSLTNTGAEPLVIPLGREFEWTPETLIMRLVVELEGSDVAFDEPFVCVPPAGCRELAPGESIEIPVELNSRRSYSVGKSEPTIWEASGAFEGEVGAYFIYPHSGAEDEVPTYTRSVEVPCRIAVAAEG